MFSYLDAITDLRIAKNGCPLASGDPALNEYIDIVSRNVNRARVRLTIEQRGGHAGSENEPRKFKANFINEPSDVELPPEVSEEFLLAQHSFPVLGPGRNAVPNPHTPKRKAPDTRAPRVGAPSVSKGDLEFSRRRAMSPPASYLIEVTTEQLRPVGLKPARGWPPFSVPSPDRDSAKVNRDPVFNPGNFRDRAADSGWVAGNAMDPLTSALEAARAVVVDPGEFRTLDENAWVLRPLVGRGFQVWGLKNRPAFGRASGARRLGDPSSNGFGFGRHPAGYSDGGIL